MPTRKNKSFRFIDLFCGIGGFNQAMSNIGGKCVFACDIDPHCRETYKNNFKINPHDDIKTIKEHEIESFDMLCAGFPCQPFSKAGKQKGFEDYRGDLFFDICRIIREHSPSYLLLENVRNLSSHDSGNSWRKIRSELTSLGYATYDNPIILNVLHFNVPQNRERMIIMCIRSDLGTLPTLPRIPKKTEIKLTNDLTKIIYNDDETEEYKIKGKQKNTEEVWDRFLKIMTSNNIQMPKFPIWTDWWDNDFVPTAEFYIKYKKWIDNNRWFYIQNKDKLERWLLTSRLETMWVGAVRKFEWQAGTLHKDDSMQTVLWSCRGSGIRVKRPNYTPTLVAMNTTPIYGPESRTLNPREILRLQSFPDNFKFDRKHIYKQAGNAVNVCMAQNCGSFIMKRGPLFP